MPTDTENDTYFRARYAEARAVFPLLPPWYEMVHDGVTPEFRGLNAARLPIFSVPPGYTLTADEVAHEAGHAYFALLPSDNLTDYWTLRGFPGTWQTALSESRAQTVANAAWQMDPRESWAEAFARSVVTTHNEKTLDYGKRSDPMTLRAFFLSLAPAPAPVVPVGEAAPITQPTAVNNSVLLHNSHRAAGKTDGWSGAPGEAQYICDILNPRIVAALARYGIQTVVIDGDLVFHPEYSADYLCFLAPHYDADVYGGAGGWFWDRAALSPTGAEDDRLGAIIRRRYSALPAVPAERSERRNPNTRDYYAFRWTTERTPGVIVELGVGWGADKDWLRANVEAIAQTLADGIAEFAGMEADMDRNTFNAWFKEEYERYGVAALFDKMKEIDRGLTLRANADDERDLADRINLDKKADKGHAHTATVSLT